MRKLLIILLVLFSSISYASWDFDEDDGDDYVTITDSDALSFGTNWSISFWYRIDERTSGYKTIIGMETFAAYDSYNQLFYGTDYHNGYLRCWTKSGYGANLEASGPYYTTDNWYNVIVVNDGATDDLYMYVDGSQVATASPTTFDSLDWTGTINIGADENGANGFHGQIAEMAKWDVLLTEDQIDRLSGTGDYSGSPYSPKDVGSPAWYIDMYDALDTSSQIGSLTLSHTGTSLSQEHPISYTSIPIIQYYRRQH